MFARSRPPRRRRIKLRSIVLLLVILLVIFFIARGKFAKSANTLEANASPNPSPSISQEAEDSTPLGKVIKPLLDETNGDYAIFVQSLSNPKEQYNLNSNQTFPAASLYKLYLLAAAQRAIEQGSITPETILKSSSARLEKILGGPDYGYEDIDGDISFSVSYAMDRIARVSDNYAAVMLAEKVTWDKIQAEAKLDGAINTNISDPITTTAEDIGEYLIRLYNGQIVSPQASENIIKLLKSSQINNRIPAQLPEEIDIAHKTGELAGIRHDAGIVYLNSSPYVIVLMSKDLKGEDTAIDTLANVSKATYDYFYGIINP